MLRKSIKNYLKNHQGAEFFLKVLIFKILHYLAYIVPDKLFLYIQYFTRTGKFLNLDAPKLYNEKLQWYKLNYKNPLLNICVDKWTVRGYVKDKGFESILIPAYGPFDSVDEIPFESLPDKFVIKLTNGSGFNIICNDEAAFDVEQASKYFRSWVDIDFFSSRREWAYKHVKNRIICEDFVEGSNGGSPNDIRFFCFGGDVKIIAIDLDSVKDGVKTSDYNRHLFTPDWEEIDARIQYPKKEGAVIPKPQNLASMLEIAKVLSEDFPAVRVDLYEMDDQVYFGELTFYHASGYQDIEPASFELEMGSYFKLPI